MTSVGWTRTFSNVWSRSVSIWYRVMVPHLLTPTLTGAAIQRRGSIITLSSSINGSSAHIERRECRTAAGAGSSESTATPAPPAASRARRGSTGRTKPAASAPPSNEPPPQSLSTAPSKVPSRQKSAPKAGARASAETGSGDAASVASPAAASTAGAAGTADALSKPAVSSSSSSSSGKKLKTTEQLKTASSTDAVPKARRATKAAAAGASAAAAAPAAPPASSTATTQMPRTQTQPSPAAAPTDRRTASTGLLLIVDGNYLANRVYFGYGSHSLTSCGVPTTVTYGVLRMLNAALRRIRPTALAVVFDPPGPTFRSAMSLLEPHGGVAAGALGAGAERLVLQGRLSWQDLASRILRQGLLLADMKEAAIAEAVATPVSYLHPSGSFLPPAQPEALQTVADVASGGCENLPSATGTGAGATAAWPRTAIRGAADMVEVLAAALGPQLSAELGLAGLAASAAADSTAAAFTPPYKAGRLSKIPEFYLDLGNLQRMLGLMSVPPLIRPWLEADDLAGLLVQQAVRDGMAVRIMSGDRDLMQLVSDAHDVALLYPATSKSSSSTSSSSPLSATPDFPFKQLREADVMAALGVVPAQVADYKALTGDDSDRLPGVSRIGPKTAAKLLASFGSLAGVHEAAAGMSAKQRSALQDALVASQYTLTMARVLGSAGAPELAPGVVPERLVVERLQLRGFDPQLVQPALMELNMRTLASSGGPGGELWAAFGGGASPGFAAATKG